MKKKVGFKLLLGLGLVPLMLSGCSILPNDNNNDGKEDNTQQEEMSDYEKQTREIYKLYVANGGTMTYEQWLASIKGEKGDKGDQGNPGTPGQNGVDGYSLLTGQGQPSVLLGKDGDSYIDLSSWDYYVKENGQWIKKGNIKGEPGSGSSFGQAGESAYQLFLRLHPDYVGTEEQWMEDLVHGRLVYYTVIFDYGYDTLVSRVQVRYNTSVAEPDVPVREGYTFKGWCNGDSLYDFSSFVYGNMTLTARWLKDGEEENVNLQLWTSYGSTISTALTKMVDNFKNDNPHINVQIVYQGGYDDLTSKILMGFATGDYPDMAFTYNDHVATFMDYGKVVRLDKFVDNSEYGWTTAEKNDIYAPYLAESQNYVLEGTYSLPFFKSTEVMCYNASVLLGLDLSSVDNSINGGQPLTEAYLNDLSWEDLFDHLIPALSTYNQSLPSDNKIIRGGDSSSAIFSYDSDDNLFITLANQYGYGYTSINKTTGVASIDFNNNGMKNLVKKIYSLRNNYQYAINTRGLSGAYSSNAISNNQTLFAVCSTAGVSYCYSNENDIKLAKLPHPEGKASKNILQGTSMVMFDQGNEVRQIAAWKLYKYLTSPENTANLSIQFGYMPMRQSAYQTEVMTEYLHTSLSGVDALKQNLMNQYNSLAASSFSTPLFKGSARARTEVGSLFVRCLQSTNLDSDIDSLFLTAENNVKMML